VILAQKKSSRDSKKVSRKTRARDFGNFVFSFSAQFASHEINSRLSCTTQSPHNRTQETTMRTSKSKMTKKPAAKKSAVKKGGKKSVAAKSKVAKKRAPKKSAKKPVRKAASAKRAPVARKKAMKKKAAAPKLMIVPPAMPPMAI
jgi:hypothetical protein